MAIRLLVISSLVISSLQQMAADMRFMVSDEGVRDACRVSASSCIDFAVSPDTLLMVRGRCRMKERENDRTRQFLSVSDLQENGAFKSYLAGLPVENGSSSPSWEGIDVFRGDIFIRRNTLRLDDPDFWYIVGVYIKRGYLPSNPRNTDLSSPYYKAVAVIKPEEASVIMAHKPKWMNLGITTGKTGETVATVATVEFSTFMSVFGRLVSDKHIPYVFHSLSPEYLRMIIAGIFSLKERMLRTSSKYIPREGSPRSTAA